MGAPINVYITLVATSGVLSLFLGIYAFINRKNIPFARTFMVYMATLCIYIFGFAFELSSNSLAEIKRWIVVEYFGMPFSAALSLLLVFRYLGKNIPRKAVSAMFIIPVITLLMVATNDAHHRFYKSIFLRESAPTPMVDIVIGEWYIVHGAYTFGCLLAGFILLLRRWTHTKKTYRIQHATLLVSQLIPMVAAFLYLMGLTPWGADPVPVVLCLTSAMYIWAIVSSRMLTIVPIAKDSIFESMREGVIVLDSTRRIIDFNQALTGMIPEISSRSIGQPLRKVWLALTGTDFPAVENIDGMEKELGWKVGGDMRFFLVRSSPVLGKGGETLGTLLLLIDVTEQKALQNELERLAYTDGLTGIGNRVDFFRQGLALLEEAAAAGTCCSFILFDIDFFKKINDTYGHEAGDKALIHVVEVCKTILPTEALFARYGGEEFVIGLPGASIREAGEVAEQLRTALEEKPFDTAGELVPITASFGAAQYAGAHDTLESLLRDADTALYESKRNGRNAVSLHPVAVS
ncbi:histidine kinase N-terminal 7TM domain-containing protein [Paenibacillus sp. TH7-28]